MNTPDHMNPAGARWCDQHERWECTKHSKRSGTICHASAVRGTATCTKHAGKRTELAKAQGQAITAWTALSGQATVSSTDAVLGMLQMSWLRVHLYAGLLERQVDAAQEAREEVAAGLARGEQVDGGIGPGVGLVGHTYGSTKDSVYASGEAVRGLALLEAQERDRCVRYAKTAHDMGIAEAQVKLVEGQGRMLAEVIRRVLDALDLSMDQKAQVPVVVPRELRAAVAGGES